VRAPSCISRFPRPRILPRPKFNLIFGSGHCLICVLHP
jgi:hypothetical protein